MKLLNALMTKQTMDKVLAFPTDQIGENQRIIEVAFPHFPGQSVEWRRDRGTEAIL